MKKLGGKTVEVEIPHLDKVVETYYIIATAEASSNLARYEGVQYGFRASGNGGGLLEMYLRTRNEGFGTEAKRRILLGTYVLSHGYYDAYYLQAQKVRQLIAADFEHAFTQVDLIIGPTTPTPAYKLGEKNNDPVTMYLDDIYTVRLTRRAADRCQTEAPWGIQLGFGFEELGVPIGGQVIVLNPVDTERPWDWNENRTFVASRR